MDGLQTQLFANLTDMGKHKATFNRTNDNIEWARWTWNPVTGCKHDCPYCYARDIANRFYQEKFEPTFRPERLAAPANTRVPSAAQYDIGERNVFVCSMADLFGAWVPSGWIEGVLAEVRANPQWNFLFLTKAPGRLAEFAFPSNAWVGTTVDGQARVRQAEQAFRDVDASVKWVSCEPMQERLEFTALELFDWVVIGGRSRSARQPEFQPKWEWVEHLVGQAREAGCMVYFKPNLKSLPPYQGRIREYPGPA